MQVLDQTSRKLTDVNTYISYIYLTSPVNSRNSGIIKIFSYVIEGIRKWFIVD